MLTFPGKHRVSAGRPLPSCNARLGCYPEKKDVPRSPGLEGTGIMSLPCCKNGFPLGFAQNSPPRCTRPSQHLLPCAPTPLPSDLEDKVVGGDRGARECSAPSPSCSWTAQAHTAQWALDHVQLLECHQQGCGKQQLWPLTHEM